jgi:5-methylcytosine-specific restriction endonuclease McrA
MFDMRVKRCSGCERDLPAWEFTKNRGRKDGLSVYCRICWNIKQAEYGKLPKYKANAERNWRAYEARNSAKRKEQKRLYREAHLDKIKARSKEYRAENRGRISERNKAHRQANPELYRARSQADYQSNIGRRREQHRRWKHANREAIRQANKAYFQANRDKAYAKAHRRRALERAATIVPFTPKQLAERWAYYGDKCWVCSDPAKATDHVKPLAKGGGHMLCNLRPICTPCNSAKRDKWPFTPDMVQRG